MEAWFKALALLSCRQHLVQLFNCLQIVGKWILSLAVVG